MKKKIIKERNDRPLRDFTIVENGNKLDVSTNASGEIVFGDPDYEAGEDIYSKGKNVGLENLADEGQTKFSYVPQKKQEDLDIPGSELDDSDEEIGEEDEENNYYSLGGENHDKPNSDFE